MKSMVKGKIKNKIVQHEQSRLLAPPVMISLDTFMNPLKLVHLTKISLKEFRLFCSIKCHINYIFYRTRQWNETDNSLYVVICVFLVFLLLQTNALIKTVNSKFLFLCIELCFLDQLFCNVSNSTRQMCFLTVWNIHPQG